MTRLWTHTSKEVSSTTWKDEKHPTKVRRGFLKSFITGVSSCVLIEMKLMCDSSVISQSSKMQY